MSCQLLWSITNKLDGAESVAQLLKNFPTFYETRRSITVSARTLHRSLSWARWIQSIPPHFISLRSILILSSHLRLYLPSGFFTSSFSPRILYPFLFVPMRAACLLISPSSTWSFWFIWRKVQVMKLLMKIEAYGYIFIKWAVCDFTYRLLTARLIDFSKTCHAAYNNAWF
jgi:hypothetical protein